MLLAFALLVGGVAAHSWLDCVDYDCPAAAPNAGPQPPAACTCKGYARNWANVMAGVPFAADRGRDNRPGASPTNGGLVCDAGKEPNPGPGTGIPAGLYSADYPPATLAMGQNVRWRWPAKNHANTPAAGTVEVYISDTVNGGDVFTTASPIRGQMSYSSDGGDCLGLATSTDTADCQGTWQVPTDLQVGRYTIMWWWEFNAGEFYNTCADVFITAAEGTPPGGGGGGVTPPGGGIGGGLPPPPPSLTAERSVVKVTMTASGSVAEYSAAKRSQIAQQFATAGGVAAGQVLVSAVGEPAGFGAVDLSIDIQTPSAADALSLQNVLEFQLSSPAAASAMLASAQVNVLNVHAVQTVLPSAIGPGVFAGLEDEKNGWKASSIAFIVILLLGAAGASYYYFKIRQRAPPAQAATPTFAMEPVTGQAVKPPPPGNVPPPAQLPPGWTASVDPASGHTYYVNAKGESTWSHPGAPASI